MNPRPITADDLTKEANRNYDLGRRHAKEEMLPVLHSLIRLFKSTAHLRVRVVTKCPQLREFSDWKENTEAMQQAENTIQRKML